MNRGFSDKDLARFFQKISGEQKKINPIKIMESLTFLKVNRLLVEILPAILRDHIKVSRIKSGTLCIAVDHGIYAQQIMLQKTEILKTLKEMGAGEITDLEVKTGKLLRKNHKTADIMSRNEKMAVNQKVLHDNAELIGQLITELKKIKNNSTRENE